MASSTHRDEFVVVDVESPLGRGDVFALIDAQAARAGDKKCGGHFFLVSPDQSRKICARSVGLLRDYQPDRWRLSEFSQSRRGVHRLFRT
jgi:hypothetical protein